MPGTNVELSKNELELVSSSEFILTKNRIIEKVYNLFGDLSESYKTMLLQQQEFLPGEIYKASPKIYKGENYLSLPYVMMDYPRTFLKQDVFAIRCFFWWGNYFSITLQLSGKYLDRYKHSIAQNLKATTEDNYFICVNENEWQHHFEESNYQLLSQTNIELILQKPFVKLAKRLALNEWNNALEFFEENYGNILKLISYPNGETDLSPGFPKVLTDL